jgi:hypothetical protein
MSVVERVREMLETREELEARENVFEDVSEELGDVEFRLLAAIPSLLETLDAQTRDLIEIALLIDADPEEDLVEEVREGVKLGEADEKRMVALEEAAEAMYAYIAPIIPGDPEIEAEQNAAKTAYEALRRKPEEGA